jgi:hypothetical protein
LLSEANLSPFSEMFLVNQAAINSSTLGDNNLPNAFKNKKEEVQRPIPTYLFASKTI